jgi:hypothetical protein
MTSSRPIPLVTVALTLLSGCAAAAAPASSSSATAAGADDCSFRSATTCWTLAPRVPAQHPAPGDSVPDQIQTPPRPVLASEADTVVGLAELR